MPRSPARNPPRKKPIPKGQSRRGTQPSTTGKVKNVQADQSNWRTRLQQSRIKFDDQQKEIYLQELSINGLKGRAQAAAGICGQTVADHREIDPDFAQLEEEALQCYRDTVAEHVKKRGQDGWLEPVYNKDGRVFEPLMNDKGQVAFANPDTGDIRFFSSNREAKEAGFPDEVRTPAYIRKFSDTLLVLEAKRVEPAYRDKQTIDLNHTGGGVLVAPADISPEDWIKREEEENKRRQDPRLRAKQEAADNLLEAKGQKQTEK